ncbi:MAG: aminoacyl-tRNA hydrolase, partial [Candidatus Rokuibacteriota bacterium]
LNADDARVMAMTGACTGRIITYGQSPNAEVRAEAIRGAWPDRLSFTAVHRGESVAVATQLCGTHWTSTVLAALATGLAVGIPLDDAARAVAQVAPYRARMSPVTLDDGVTFIRDDWKAPLLSVPPALEFLKQARARRKIAIFGTVSDYRGRSGPRYVAVARAALEAADHVIFVGPSASKALRARSRAGDAALHTFAHIRDASAHLARVLQPGDLVLLKGSHRADHLVRLMLARSQAVHCWRTNCKKSTFCDHCSQLQIPPRPSAASANSKETIAPVGVIPRVVVSPAPPAEVIVGLGNPGEQYEGTPHNLGWRVVEMLRTSLGELWTPQRGALVCHARWRGEAVCLVKLLVPMNRIGPALHDLSTDLGVDRRPCILVHDDVDLPLGSLRVRMSGSDGGHRGVASIIQAFQRLDFPRIKIGVGRPPAGTSMLDHLLRPFPAEAAPAMERACEAAVERILALISSRGS